MTTESKLALFIGGVIFGSAGFKILASKDARKVYTHVTAASLRCKDEVMKNVELIQESCSDHQRPRHSRIRALPAACRRDTGRVDA